MKLQITKNPQLLFAINILMLVSLTDIPTWVSLFSWFLVLFKIGSEKWNFPSLSRRVTTVLSALFLLQIYLEFKTLLGQEPSTSLLMGLAAIKVVDYETPRDHKYLVILGFILLSMKPLFSLDLYWLPFLLCAFVGLWWSMLRPEQPKPLSFLGRLFVSSVPVALALFLIFPRFVFPWAARANQSRAQMGFSENLNPGESAELAETDRLIFRARFEVDKQPSVESLYWRGGVLRESKGLSWAIGQAERKTSLPNLAKSEKTNSISYDVYLEPGTQNYVFVLETAERVSGTNLFIRGFDSAVYRLPFPINKTVLYQGSSDLTAVDATPPAEEDLQTPELSGKVRQWVDAQQKKSPQEKIANLEKLYLRNKFIYTLNPGTYGSNDLEEFLFERRQGFCEHFAGSYATLARALGVPARVIVGFQGGNWNEYGSFWRISTKDAHAWVEIFLNNQWQRVDPTGFAAPLRLTVGATEYFQGLVHRDNFLDQIVLLKDQFLAFIENLNYSWTSFLIDFDTDFQKELVKMIRQNIGWAILLILAFSIVILGATRFLARRALKLNAFQILFFEMMEWGTRHGLPRSPSESPGRYLARLAKTHQQLQPVADQFSEAYENEFYAPPATIATRSGDQQSKRPAMDSHVPTTSSDITPKIAALRTKSRIGKIRRDWKKSIRETNFRKI